MPKHPDYNHILYVPEDMKEFDPESNLVNLVCNGGLSICKICGAGESELDEYPTCEEFNSRPS